ncbi:MAG: DUF5672 family protein [Sediminibacterium sp.]
MSSNVNTTNAVIAVPIYTTNLTFKEIGSINQCIEILSDYPIFFIAPFNLNTKFYEEKFNDIHIKRFPDKYFTNINSYNKLLLQPFFYNFFKKYTYLLIYQSDAWVFKNELSYWCNKGFDFIGAPWFEGYVHGETNAKMIGVGNGGFSLRNISKARRILYSFSYIDSPITVLKKRIKLITGLYTFLTQLWAIILDLTIRNNTFYLFNNFRGNEDAFWSVFAGSKFIWYSVPPPEIAMYFSFECNPSLLFDKTNKNLPFGCHAWDKYDPLFWSKFIEIN